MELDPSLVSWSSHNTCSNDSDTKSSFYIFETLKDTWSQCKSLKTGLTLVFLKSYWFHVRRLKYTNEIQDEYKSR